MRLHRLFIPAVLSLLLAGAGASAAAQPTFPTKRQALSDVSQAFGFLYGQQLTLEHIRTRYPGLAAQVKIAESSINLAYSGADTFLESVLVGVVGDDGFAEMTDHFYAEMEGIPESQTQSREDALAFLGEVRARAEDAQHIPSPIRELILTATYADHPEQELLDGHRAMFSTTGHDKSMGLDLTMTLPLSWLAREGRRPHIVQKWRSQGGHGRAEIMLLIQDLGMPLTSEEVEEMMANEDFSTWVPDEVEYLDASRLRIDNQPSVAIDYVLTQEVGTATVLIRTRQYQMFVDDKGIALQCQAGAAVGDGPTAFETLDAARASAAEVFAANERLCYLTANSIVVDQIWR
ncbi:hypothetical protein [Halomonas aquatica]|uniref:Uncharacterized protein n=1 Tax=Halomonas aquatica TaxID=3151123 RepID=A0ABV1NI67_9GAMM